MKTAKLISIILLLTFVTSSYCQDLFFQRLADSTITLTYDQVEYDPDYFSIDYPNGDIPADKGVCTDVIIRAYRKVGIDLQKEVHKDILFDYKIIGHYLYNK